MADGFEKEMHQQIMRRDDRVVKEENGKLVMYLAQEQIYDKDAIRMIVESWQTHKQKFEEWISNYNAHVENAQTLAVREIERQVENCNVQLQQSERDWLAEMRKQRLGELQHMRSFLEKVDAMKEEAKVAIAAELEKHLIEIESKLLQTKDALELWEKTIE